jgi:hypothetical protein
MQPVTHGGDWDAGGFIAAGLPGPLSRGEVSADIAAATSCAVSSRSPREIAKQFNRKAGLALSLIVVYDLNNLRLYICRKKQNLQVSTIV